MTEDPKVKLAMYSHDTFGLGHIRRTLLIAEHLSMTFPDISTLILSGSSMIHSMRIAENLDYIKLPCLTKKTNSDYLPKFLKKFPSDVKKIRKDIIFNTLRSYHPDVLIVDKAPIGVIGELRESLEYLRNRRPETKIILGIRDVLDCPEHVRNEWEKAGLYRAIQSYYDEVWVYGAKEIYDVVKEYRFPSSVAEKVRYLGYLRRQELFHDPVEIRKRLGIGDRKMVLLTLGGGGDGHHLVETFMSILTELLEQHDIAGLIVTGPDYSNSHTDKDIRIPRLGNGNLVKDFTVDIFDYMNAADLVVSMGGYNTVCEILSLNKKAIVVPRTHPRTEQLIRATRLSEIGLLNVLPPGKLSPRILKDEILKNLSNGSSDLHPSEVIDFNGLSAIKNRFRDLTHDLSIGDSLAPLLGRGNIIGAIRSDREEDHS